MPGITANQARRNPLQEVLDGPDGDRLSKIEIEILDDGRCRWNLWNGAKRIFSQVANRGDRRGMIDATRSLVDTYADEQAGRALEAN